MQFKIKKDLKKDLSELLQAIETKRLKLVESGMAKGFQDCEVIKLSEELDKLIVEYHRKAKKLGE